MAAPLDTGTLVIHALAGIHKLGQLTLVLALDSSQSQGSGGLLVYYCSEAGLALDNAVRDTHLLAEGGEPDDNLNGIDIVSNDNKLCLALLNQSGDVVDAILDDNRLLLLNLLACNW